MGVINFNLDDKKKKKIKEIVEKKGFKNINEFLNKVIDDEIKLQGDILYKNVKPQIFDKELNEDEIIDYLSKISSELKKLSDHDKKIQKLVELDDFLIEYKEIIKEKCPDMLVSILNSL